METCYIDADRILNVWNWCSDAYLRNGQKLSLPANTDPTRTYQWRYARTIAEKFAEWEFDDNTCRKFIDLAVKYAKQKGVLRKGLAVLHQSNMLNICHEMLRDELHNSKRSQDSLEAMHNWFRKQIGTNRPIEVLLERPRDGAMCNLTQWYRARRISELYLAISRSCCKALARLEKLDPDERSMLPKVAKLHMLRRNLVRDLETFKKAKQILGKDWRELCL